MHRTTHDITQAEYNTFQAAFDFFSEDRKGKAAVGLACVLPTAAFSLKPYIAADGTTSGD